MRWLHYDVIAFGAHPNETEAVTGGTVAKRIGKGRSALLVDLYDGEPARHAARGGALSRRRRPHQDA